MPDSTYLELNDDVGVTADGNLEPLVAIGVSRVVPTMVKDGAKTDVIDVAQSYTVEAADTLGRRLARFLPGTRIVECVDPQITSALLAGSCHLIDPPKKADAAKQAKSLTDAREEAGTHAQDPDHPERG